MKEHEFNTWTKFLLHLHPPKVHSRSIRYTRTFGLGGISALLFVLLAFSGLLLRFKYIPSAVAAYDSLVDMERNHLFGHLLRGVHYWSANLLILVSFLHLLRVVFSQSIYGERRKNWVYGLLLFLLIVAFNFTGYLLPWDQLSFWAVTIVTEMFDYIPVVGDALTYFVRGGTEVGEHTLLTFYHLHTGVLPLVFVCLMCIHFWLVRKAKGVTYPKDQGGEMVSSYPHLVRIEIIAALIVCVLVFSLSLLFDVPMLAKAHPEISPNPSKAPWYFIGFQELLIHFNPVLVICLVPAITLGLFFFLPYFKPNGLQEGVWFNSVRGRVAVNSAVLLGGLWTFVYILLSDYFLQDYFAGFDQQFFASTVSLLIYLVPLLLFVFLLKKRLSLPGTEMRLVYFSLAMVSYVVMGIVAYFFRGEGMALIF